MSSIELDHNSVSVDGGLEHLIFDEFSTGSLESLGIDLYCVLWNSKNNTHHNSLTEGVVDNVKVFSW